MTSDTSTEDEITMNDDEIESIINQVDDVVPVTDVSEQDAEYIENLCDGSEAFEKLEKVETVLDDMPQLRGKDYPEEYLKIRDIVVSNYRSVPQVDHMAVYDELGSLSVATGSTPTIQQIQLQLQRVQAAKERLSEMITQILPSHTIKKRSIEILKDAWGRFSKESSDAKRKSDAIFRIAEFDSDFGKVDALLKTCMHISKNLDSSQENLSRRITIMGLQLKLNDMGRMAIPDHDFSPRQDFESTLVSSVISEEGDENGTPETEELSF